LGPEFLQQLKELTSPEALGAMALFVAAQAFGLGEAADAVGVTLLVVKIGTDAFKVVGDFATFFDLAINGKTDDDFDTAGQALANAITLAGVDAILVLLAARAKEGEQGEEGGGKEEGGSGSNDENKQADDNAKSAETRQQRLEELSNDPDKGGISPGSQAEAADALTLEESGEVPGPVRRANGKIDPRENGADFVDGDGGLWDHKFAKSDRGFDSGKFLDKIQQRDIPNREKIMLNHEGLTEGDRSLLLKEIDARGLMSSFKFIPPL
jgi:hypothetical protein